MRLDDQRESSNVEDRRGSGGGLPMGRKGVGTGTVAIALVVSYFTGINPATLLNIAGTFQGGGGEQVVAAHKPPANDEMARFISKVLSSTEDTWRDLFQQSGKAYQDPKLVLFTGATPTACGTGANFVKQIKGSVGYVEAAYMKQNRMNYIRLQNLDGEYVQPTEESFTTAAAHTQWDRTPGFYEILTNKPGAKSWPITGATFILMHKTQSSPEHALAVLKFFEWAYAHGDQLALELDYIPMPDDVVKLIEASWNAAIKSQSGLAIYSLKP